YGSALKAGIRAARGAFIGMGDAEDGYAFGELQGLGDEWRKGKEVVMGNGLAGEIKRGGMRWHNRYIENPGLTALLNYFSIRGLAIRIAGCADLHAKFLSEWICAAAEWSLRRNL